MNSKQPSISIITICRNIEKEIGQTLSLILAQTYQHYELIIIDGMSSDGTIRVIKDFITQFEEKDITVTFISEPDHGIYDAMNKGIDRAQNEWIIFMNGGDSFVGPDVLQSIFASPIDPTIDIIYGDTRLRGVNVVMKPKPLDYLHKKMAFCHKSVFIKSALHKEIKFDTRWKILGDFDFFRKCYLQNRHFLYRPIQIASYDFEGGVSRKKKILGEKERANITGEANRYSWKIKYALLKTENSAKNVLNYLIPSRIKKSIRQANYRRLANRRIKNTK